MHGEWACGMHVKSELVAPSFSSKIPDFCLFLNVLVRPLKCSPAAEHCSSSIAVSLDYPHRLVWSGVIVISTQNLKEGETRNQLHSPPGSTLLFIISYNACIISVLLI